jgi:hypothetical protein
MIGFLRKDSVLNRTFFKLFVIIAILIPLFLFIGKLPDSVRLNWGNIAILKHPGIFSQTNLGEDVVSTRILENAQVASATTQIHGMDLVDELYLALKTLQPNIPYLSKLYRMAGQGFLSLQPYLLPADLNVQLTQHADGSGWQLVGLSIAQLSEINSDVPLSAQSVAKPYLSDELVGVPVGFSVLNADPRFTISAQLKNKRFSKSYPYLVNFQNLVMNGIQGCKANYVLHADVPQQVYLELWPGCALDSPSYPMHPDEIFLMINRFKTTEGCRGTLGVWWNVNVGHGTGGRYPNDWVTQVLLFDSLRDNASSGRLQFAAYEGGSALLDFVFLLRLGKPKGKS